MRELLILFMGAVMCGGIFVLPMRVLDALAVVIFVGLAYLMKRADDGIFVLRSILKIKLAEGEPTIPVAIRQTTTPIEEEFAERATEQINREFTAAWQPARTGRAPAQHPPTGGSSVQKPQ